MESNSAAPDNLYRPMQRQNTGEPEDNFYDPMTTPEYENARNQESVPTVEQRQLTQEEEEWQAELAKLEQEIMTLRSVLSVKVQQAGELKRKLGLGVITEIKQDFRQGLQSIKESDAYQKTNETVHQLGDSIASSEVYLKTNAALRSFGNFASRKMGDVRNSNTFRSMEERIGGAYGTVKSKVSGSQSENSFEQALATSATNTSADTTSASTPSTPGTEKVPL